MKFMPEILKTFFPTRCTWHCNSAWIHSCAWIETVRDMMWERLPLRQCNWIDQLIDWATTDRERRSSRRQQIKRLIDETTDGFVFTLHSPPDRPALTAAAAAAAQTSSQPSIIRFSSVASTGTSTRLYILLTPVSIIKLHLKLTHSITG